MSFYCNVCQKTFQHRSSMYRHRKNAHGANKKQNQYNCAHCKFKSTIKRNLIRHLNNDHHSSGCKKPSARLICPKCNMRVSRYEVLDSHLSDDHNINIEEEYLEFGDENEFQLWKLNMEKATHTHYVTTRGLRKHANYCQRELICHRSYIGKSILTNRKRALKSLGSNKLSTTCPSRMVVIITDVRVTVSFVGTHIGHHNELIRLPPDRRATTVRADKPTTRSSVRRRTLLDVRKENVDEEAQNDKENVDEDLQNGKENVDEELQTKLQQLMLWSSSFSDDDKKLLLKMIDKVLQKINFQKYKENYNPVQHNPNQSIIQRQGRKT